MLRIFRVLTKSSQENIAIDIIKSFEANYHDSSYKIYQYDELLNNLISVIGQTININEYSNLKWKEQNEAESIMIKAIKQLEQNSKNTVPFKGSAYKSDGLKGMEMMNFEDEGMNFEDGGWNYYRTWDAMKFPDVFYNKEMQPILQNTITSAIENTKFDAILLSKKEKTEYEKILKNKKITQENNQSVKNHGRR